jgi:putative hemolysin
MKTFQLVGLCACVSMVVACASQTEPAPGTAGEQQSPVVGQPSGPGSSQPAPAPAPPPAPAPAPAPVPGCAPLAASGGSANPASVYCSELGYQLTATSQCAFPDGTSCEEWAFYRGECGQAHSFCNLHGGTVANKVENMGTWTASYAECTLPDGKQCQDDTFAHTCSCL